MVPTLCTGELNDSNTHVVITLKQHVETQQWRALMGLGLTLTFLFRLHLHSLSWLF